MNVYTPVLLVGALAIDGLCKFDVYPAGPVQLNVVAVPVIIVLVRFRVLPLHIVPLVDADVVSVQLGDH